MKWIIIESDLQAYSRYSKPLHSMYEQDITARNKMVIVPFNQAVVKTNNPH
ncbi:MAG: hypothetical protein Q7U54_02555 [Bacteroidales bacterium]|nr:hypothetical protein [Bacteroidales bacterium]